MIEKLAIIAIGVGLLMLIVRNLIIRSQIKRSNAALKELHDAIREGRVIGSNSYMLKILDDELPPQTRIVAKDERQ